MKFVEQYGDGDIQIFSAPGRSEIGGNHTDHQHVKAYQESMNQIFGYGSSSILKIRKYGGIQVL